MPGTLEVMGDSAVYELDDSPISDEELTALALAADPDAVAGNDAIPLRDPALGDIPGLLPAWYMPSATASRPLRGWRRRVVWLVVVSFLLINAYGLCSTYGYVAFG